MDGDKEEPNNQEADNDSSVEEDKDSNQGPSNDDDNDDEAPDNQASDDASFLVSDNERREGYNKDVSYEPKDEIIMGR